MARVPTDAEVSSAARALDNFGKSQKKDPRKSHKCRGNHFQHSRTHHLDMLTKITERAPVKRGTHGAAKRAE